MIKKALARIIMALAVISCLAITDNITPALASEGVPVISTHHDNFPNFAYNPTIMTAKDGNWSDPSVWASSRLPGDNDIVLIKHAISYESSSGVADVIGIASTGKLSFRHDMSTKLSVGILQVLPGGYLSVGTEALPVIDSASAEISIKDKAIMSSVDPDQWGTGLLVIDGTVSMHGSIKLPTFARTSISPKAGDASVSLEAPVTGWKVGDKVFLPDTRQVPDGQWFNTSYVLQVDTRSIQGISPDNKVITLSAPLTYNHKGARDANGTPTVWGGVKLLPHLGNITRNIVIRSVNPNGTRGHTVYTHRSSVDIRYVQYQDMGRTRATTIIPTTNHIGRYPLHLHHLWGLTNPSNTGYQFKVIGNAINDSLKWPLAIHGSHYGLINANVIYGGSQLTGAGIALEDGTETENLINGNFVSYVIGNVNPRESGSDTATPGSGGECYWAAGFNNRFVGNVAATCRNTFQQIGSGVGWKFFMTAAPFSGIMPKFRGADMGNPAETQSVVAQMQPILEFRSNEAYGAMADGITAWNLGTDGYNLPTAQESLIKDFKVWHTYEGGFLGYPTNRVTIDGMIFRADNDLGSQYETGWTASDYRTINLTIRGGSFHSSGVLDANAIVGIITLENIEATTKGSAFSLPTPETPGTQAGIPNPPAITVNLRNNKVTAWPNGSLRTISMQFRTGTARHPNIPYSVFAYDHQKVAGDSFRVYFAEQATQDVHGGVAPCTSTRPDINGIVCPIGTIPPPPIDCVVDDPPWVLGTPEPVVCPAGGIQTRVDTRTLTVLTQPANGGKACPPLEETRSVTVSCIPIPPPISDSEVPELAILAPGGSSVKAGSVVVIKACTEDNVGVVKVDFFLNSVMVKSDTSAPYSHSWSVPATIGTKYVIKIISYDAAGNKVSRQKTVTAK